MADDEVIDPLLSTRKCADIFGVTTETIRDWIDRGRLDGVKIGNNWRVKESSVRRLVNSGAA